MPDSFESFLRMPSEDIDCLAMPEYMVASVGDADVLVPALTAALAKYFRLTRPSAEVPYLTEAEGKATLDRTADTLVPEITKPSNLASFRNTELEDIDVDVLPVAGEELAVYDDAEIPRVIPAAGLRTGYMLPAIPRSSCMDDARNFLIPRMP